MTELPNEFVAEDECVEAPDWWLDKEVRVRSLSAKQIDRFAKRERARRTWISFKDIAEWCARSTGDILIDPMRLNAAYDELKRAWQSGSFDHDGRSKVLFLNEYTPKKRFNNEELQFVIDNHSDENFRVSYLPWCWIPRWLAERWFRLMRHKLPEWLADYELSGALVTSHTLPSSKKVSGRKPTHRDAAKSHLAKAYPDGVPDGISNHALQSEINAALRTAGSQLTVGERTVRRARDRA
jgi:hypothetical protein